MEASAVISGRLRHDVIFAWFRILKVLDTAVYRSSQARRGGFQFVAFRIKNGGLVGGLTL